MGGTVQIFRNNPNESIAIQEENKKQIEVRECLQSFGAESFVF
jgi:hypothetical protein